MTKHFRCPACGFSIFNRRVPNCEACLATLPIDLLFTAYEISRIEAQHLQNELVRAKLAADAERESKTAADRQQWETGFFE